MIGIFRAISPTNAVFPFRLTRCAQGCAMCPGSAIPEERQEGALSEGEPAEFHGWNAFGGCVIAFDLDQHPGTAVADHKEVHLLAVAVADEMQGEFALGGVGPEISFSSRSRRARPMVDFPVWRGPERKAIFPDARASSRMMAVRYRSLSITTTLWGRQISSRLETCRGKVPVQPYLAEAIPASRTGVSFMGVPDGNVKPWWFA